MKNRFFRYYGNKLHFVDRFNEIARLSKKKNYIELMVGSGAVFFNLENNYDSYIINDLDTNIICMYYALQYFNYRDFEEINENIMHKFGDIKNNKESFYNFRNWFNEYIYFNINELKGIYLYFLYNSCMNNIPRFGKSGFTGSYGGRFLFFNSKEEFDLLKNKVSKVKIMNVDYTVFEDIKDALILMDPPYHNKTYYTDQSSHSYEIHELFINKLIENGNDVIYTNIYKEDFLTDFKQENIRIMRNISPHKKSEITNIESVWYYIN